MSLDFVPIAAAIAAVVLGVGAALGADRAYRLSNVARAQESWPGPEPLIIDYGEVVEERRGRERAGELAGTTQRSATFAAIGAAFEGVASSHADAIGVGLLVLGLASGILIAIEIGREIAREPVERARIAYEVWNVRHKWGPHGEDERYAAFAKDNPKAAKVLRDHRRGLKKAIQ